MTNFLTVLMGSRDPFNDLDLNFNNMMQKWPYIGYANTYLDELRMYTDIVQSTESIKRGFNFIRGQGHTLRSRSNKSNNTSQRILLQKWYKLKIKLLFIVLNHLRLSCQHSVYMYLSLTKVSLDSNDLDLHFGTLIQSITITV